MKTFVTLALLLSIPFLAFAQEAEWVELNDGLENLHVYTIVANPLNPDILYAGSDEGFCRSENRGEDWECLLEQLRVRSIWVDPDSSERILITRGDGSRSDGIWVSYNGGDDFEVFNWVRYPYALTSDENRPNYIFCGTRDGEIFYTINNGNNWSEASDGIEGEVHHLRILSDEDDSYVFACTNRGLYRAVIDDDIEWEEVGPHELPAYQTAVNFDEDGGMFVGTADESDSDGLYYTDDCFNVDTDEWDIVRWNFYVRAVETFPELLVMGSTESGVSRSEDGGRNWTEMNEELDDFDMTDLLLVKYDDDIVCYLTHESDGIFSYVIPPGNQPSHFDLLNPVDNDTILGAEITFRWEESEDPDDEVSYTWYLQSEQDQVSADIDDTSFEVDLDDLEFEYEFGNILTWWVVAEGGNEEVECNNRFSFLILSDNLPSRFNLLEPANGDSIEEAQITFRWQESEHPEGDVTYTWLIRGELDSTFIGNIDETSLDVNLDELELRYNPGEPLLWWVIATWEGNSIESNSRFSFVAGAASTPSHFNLLAPADNSVLEELDITFRWEASEDPDGDVVYVWNLRNDRDSVTLEDIRDTSVDINIGEIGIAYELEDVFTWWVQAVESRDTVASNSSFNFRVTSNAPGAFNLLEPVNGDTLEDPDVTFRWEESENPENDVVYDWWIQNGQDSTSINDIENTSLDVNIEALDIDIITGDTLVWWVLAVSEEAERECNTRFSFRYRYLTTPPEPFNLLEPGDGDTLDYTEIPFTWEASADPDTSGDIAYIMWFKVEDDSVSFDSEDTQITIDLTQLNMTIRYNVPYIWGVLAIAGTDTTPCIDNFSFMIQIEQVSGGGLKPEGFGIINAYPNPFNAATRIHYSTPINSEVVLSIYNLSGNLVEALYSGHRDAGNYEAVWNGKNNPNGVYLCRLKSETSETNYKLVLVK